ncbi:hypothetical protein KIN20_037144 [Parelaphostrongylus tenuis]|uniref:Uncharacterized protein n=1 Tax=Parelaphostrongylus tenuis TaxID=148309 RepID=A0AAD5RDJ3_PARTN|nr:hypothetical protein KIN20_037144 [Parelaphostrongylus tenuis]
MPVGIRFRRGRRARVARVDRENRSNEKLLSTTPLYTDRLPKIELSQATMPSVLCFFATVSNGVLKLQREHMGNCLHN